MNIAARLKRVLREKIDPHSEGYSFLYLTMEHSNKVAPVYGNPIDSLVVMCIVNDIPFDTLCRYYEGIRRDYPEFGYVRSRYTSKHAAEDYLTLCGAVLTALNAYEWRYSPMNRPDRRNLDWLRGYFENKYEEVSEKELAWKS